jgi:arylsulfatase
MALRTSPGLTVVRRHLPAAKARRWKAASASLASSVGRAKFKLVLSTTASSQGLIGFPPSSLRQANVVQELLNGKELGGKTYKVHLDGYNQLDFITAKSPSKRNEIFYFAETTLGAVRIGDFKYRFIDQPGGWLDNTVKVDWPFLTNLRLDPFERTGLTGSMQFADWYKYEFWRFVFVQQEVGKFAQSFIDFPPMQAAASFNMEAVKQQIEAAMKSRQGN